jgi:hypothetical protein
MVRGALTLLFACVALAGANCVRAAQPIAGVDHIPIAVRDLDAAAAQYRLLGFTLKPGTLHPNSILNMHAKHADGTELELITATEPRDALAEKYLRYIAAGDGPAFLALHADLDAVAKRFTHASIPFSRTGDLLEPTDPSLDYLFFVHDNHSPTDKSEHFVHANTSQSLIGAWVADAENPKLVELLSALGARVETREVSMPGKTRVQFARLANGELTLFPASYRRIPDRPVIGAVLATADVAQATGHAMAGGLPVVDYVHTSDGGISVMLPPAYTNGLWIEFRQSRGRK